MLVGLIVEGVFDEAVFAELVPRLLVGATTRAVHAKPSTVQRALESCARFLRPLNPERILAIMDADKRAQNQFALERQTADFAAKCTRLSPAPRPVVIIRELEALLLADPAAVNRVCEARANRIGTPRPGTPRDTEQLVDPKLELARTLGTFGIRYTERVAAEIARTASLEVLAQFCPQSFGQLRQALK